MLRGQILTVLTSSVSTGTCTCRTDVTNMSLAVIGRVNTDSTVLATHELSAQVVLAHHVLEEVHHAVGVHERLGGVRPTSTQKVMAGGPRDNDHPRNVFEDEIRADMTRAYLLAYIFV